MDNIYTLNPKPSEVIVMTINKNYPLDDAYNKFIEVKACFPNNKCLAMFDDMTLETMSKEELEQTIIRLQNFVKEV